MSERPILYCHCAYAKVVPPETKRDVLAALSASDQPFDGVADLCEMSARRDPLLKELTAQADLRIVACYPRAVKWLFAAAGAKLPDDAQVLNMRAQSAAEIAAALDLAAPACAAAGDDS
jgi:hypothetical protein